MIEVWLDSGEAFFCVGGRIDLHIRSGTVSRVATKICDLQTNSMQEAHKMFADQLAADGDEQLADDVAGEGFD